MADKQDIKQLLENSILDTEIFFKKHNCSVMHYNQVLKKLRTEFLDNLKNIN